MGTTLEKVVKGYRDLNIKKFKEDLLDSYRSAYLKNSPIRHIPEFIHNVRMLYADTPFFSTSEAVRYEFLYYFDELNTEGEGHPVFDLSAYDFLEYVDNERNFELWDYTIEAMYDDISDETKFKEILKDKDYFLC